MPSKNKQPTHIRERKLGRYKAHGLCYEDGTVEIDERLQGEERLQVTVHELLHRHLPYLDEMEVDRLGTLIGSDLWAAQWRQVR